MTKRERKYITYWKNHIFKPPVDFGPYPPNYVFALKDDSEKEFMGWPIKGEGIPEGFQRCPDCGELVGAGLLPRIKHWGDCGGKGVVEAVQEHYDMGKPITIEEINRVISDQVEKNFSRSSNP